jgi:hypothetical protein
MSKGDKKRRVGPENRGTDPPNRDETWWNQHICKASCMEEQCSVAWRGTVCLCSKIWKQRSYISFTASLRDFPRHFPDCLSSIHVTAAVNLPAIPLTINSMNYFKGNTEIKSRMPFTLSLTATNDCVMGRWNVLACLTFRCQRLSKYNTSTVGSFHLQSVLRKACSLFQTHEGIWNSGGRAVFIHNLGTKCDRWSSVGTR